MDLGGTRVKTKSRAPLFSLAEQLSFDHKLFGNQVLIINI